MYDDYFRNLRAYLRILRDTLNDFISFFILFALVNLAFTGGFSAALRFHGPLSLTNNSRTGYVVLVMT